MTSNTGLTRGGVSYGGNSVNKALIERLRENPITMPDAETVIHMVNERMDAADALEACEAQIDSLTRHIAELEFEKELNAPMGEVIGVYGFPGGHSKK